VDILETARPPDIADPQHVATTRVETVARAVLVLSVLPAGDAARKTWPIPPAPSRPSSRYSPTVCGSVAINASTAASAPLVERQQGQALLRRSVGGTRIMALDHCTSANNGSAFTFENTNLCPRVITVTISLPACLQAARA